MASLVVREQFHVLGALKEVGDLLSAEEQKVVELDQELHRRCIRVEMAISADAKVLAADVKKTVADVKKAATE